MISPPGFTPCLGLRYFGRVRIRNMKRSMERAIGLSIVDNVVPFRCSPISLLRLGTDWIAAKRNPVFLDRAISVHQDHLSFALQHDDPVGTRANGEITHWEVRVCHDADDDGGDQEKEPPHGCKDFHGAGSA
jgi:hypothetical protein